MEIELCTNLMMVQDKIRSRIMHWEQPGTDFCNLEGDMEVDQVFFKMEKLYHKKEERNFEIGADSIL